MRKLRYVSLKAHFVSLDCGNQGIVSMKPSDLTLVLYNFQPNTYLHEWDIVVVVTGS